MSSMTTTTTGRNVKMEYELVLQHHGIKGMRWGVRRYQNRDGSLTPKGKERYHNKKSGMSAFAQMRPLGANGYPLPGFAHYGEDWLRERIENPHSPGSKNWWYPEHKEIREKRYRQDYIDDPDSVFEKHMHKINETNGEEIGTTNNCTKVASSMILAKMGYDYDAGRSMSGMGEAFEYWFEGAERTLCDDLASAIDTKFSKTKNGSYGTVDLRNRNGGGHVFNWERNSAGEFSLYEAQVKGGEKFSGSTPEECFEKYVKKRPWFSSESTVRVYDMTDAKPNWNAMAEDSVLRITDGSYTSALFDEHTKRDYSGF